MQNYWKQRTRRNSIASAYSAHMSASPGAARIVIKSAPREDRVIGIIQTIDTHGPRRRVLKNGTRRIVYK